jgi:transposase
VTAPATRRKYNQQFRDGAVRIVEETGEPIAQVARGLRVSKGTLRTWVQQARTAREGRGEMSEAQHVELERLRVEVAELRTERDVLKRSVALWAKVAPG